MFAQLILKLTYTAVRGIVYKIIPLRPKNAMMGGTTSHAKTGVNFIGKFYPPNLSKSYRKK